jgi:hypothetical protein
VAFPLVPFFDVGADDDCLCCVFYLPSVANALAIITVIQTTIIDEE